LQAIVAAEHQKGKINQIALLVHKEMKMFSHVPLE
jgi:hypothetical protein